MDGSSMAFAAIAALAALSALVLLAARRGAWEPSTGLRRPRKPVPRWKRVSTQT